MSCPAESELREFWDARLSEESIELLADHIASCPRCDALIGTMNHGDDGVHAVLQLAGKWEGILEDPGFRDFCTSIDVERPGTADRSPPAKRDTEGHPESGSLDTWSVPREAKPVPDSTSKHVSNTDASETISVESPRDQSDSFASPRAPVVDDGAPHRPRVQASRDAATIPPSERVYGRYRVRELLGKGGFGCVYLAVDEELERIVAIKVPRTDRLASARAVNSFMHEARMAAKLDHLNIVSIYDVGRRDDGSCFIVMEHIAGGSLADVIQSKGQVSHQDAARWVGMAAEAVHAAHKQGLVHRDLKPANLLMAEDGRCLVTDFGLAILDDAQRMHAGEIAGTPSYMPPELMRGESHLLDGRADIWSLGVILYELLTGVRPFRGDRFQVRDEILHRPVKPPRQVDDRIPKSLEQIVLRCLAKDLHDRYLTALDLARDLKKWERSTIPRSHRYWSIGAAVAVTAIMLIAMLTAYRGLIPWAAPEHNLLDEQGTLDAMPPGQWVDLLYREPSQLAGPTVSDASRWSFDKSRGEVMLDSGDFTLLELGETQATSFRYQIGIQRNVWHGNVGLFWGYQIVSLDDERPTAKCQGIIIHTQPVDDRFAQHMVRRELYTIQFVEGQSFVSKKRFGIDTPVNIPIQEESLLEIRVEQGRLASVRLNGQPLDALADKRPTTAGETFTECRGKLGIANFSGASIVRGVRFMSLTEVNHE